MRPGRSQTAAGAAAPALPSAGVTVALRNAAKMGASLLGTWGIAVVVRLLMPRVLGPEAFGVVSFADALTASVFVLLTFGADTYIRKEVTLRERHADDFFGGLTLVRVALTFVLLGALALAMELSNQSTTTRHAVYLFAVGQLFFVQNNSLSAVLHARARVDGLSVINVASKVLWGAGIGGALWLGGGARAIAAVFLGAEALRMAVLFWLARRHTQLELGLRPRAALAVIVASLPFFLSVISQTVCSRIGSSLLGFFTTKEEVGLYGAAWTLAGMALLLAPLMNWVLMPLLSQAGARSEEELLHKARRATELIVSVTAPVALILSVGADVWVTLLFGEAYAPAVWALRVMAPVFVLTYVAMVNSTCLVVLGRAWATTRVAIGTLLLMPLLIAGLAPLFATLMGAGGPGVGAALALLLAECVAMGRLVYALRGRTFDRESLTRIVRIAGICFLVLAVDRTMSDAGPVRLAVDALVYSLLAVATGAFPLELGARLLRGLRPGAAR